jgi:hypothetical protein
VQRRGSHYLLLQAVLLCGLGMGADIRAATSAADACADISGSFVDRSDAGGESLAVLLSGVKELAGGVTSVRIERDTPTSMLITVSPYRNFKLERGTAFECDNDEIRLLAPVVSGASVPSVLTASKSMQYTFRKDAQGDLVAAVSTTIREQVAGLQLSGPPRPDTPLRWKAMPAAQGSRPAPKPAR